jgi:hypothetical protein
MRRPRSSRLHQASAPGLARDSVWASRPRPCLESLVALLIILGISLVGLDPSINRVVFAVFLISCALGSAISPIRATRAYRSSHVKPIAYDLRLSLASLLVLGYAGGGVSFLVQAGGGLHWLPCAFILAIAIAASNAWILLVEVLR